ncbi:hypothetical protein MLD38_019378 [Melastoma candidum]|uniref:Uncharacterized protein n=1 Tax=Melastoma candidum TaxID=119954 RepID=A0ACB9QWU2_9MYRT|nr:hypothetical protein MLD38_019378 [Melastoma candidum]
MSKKKAVGGSTMTLKDFHGGSIPSDLPLPSAPGLVARPAERGGYDRSVSWGSSTMGRPEIHRGTRPNSSHGSSRHFDDKTPFLNPNVLPIGRNFDEDERKPLDGSSAPRRTISDDTVRAPMLRPEPRSVPGLGGTARSQVLQVSGRADSLNMGGGVVEGIQSGWGVTGGGNVWAARRDAVSMVSGDERVFAAASAASKLVHASALEKVSSGRWQSRVPCHEERGDVEVVKPIERERELVSKGFDDSKYRTRRDYGEGVQVGGNEGVNHKATSNVASMGGKESSSFGRTEVMVSQFRFQNPVSSDVSERPKLKLTLRTKPLENSEQPVQEVKRVVSRPAEVDHPDTQDAKHVLPGVENTNQIVERPKLNLKPRSQPIDPVEPNADVDRSAVFGGARPREMVLKERGIDYVSSENHDVALTSDRPKSFPKNERLPSNATMLHCVKSEDVVVDSRNVKKFERGDQKADDRSDSQKRNWQSDNPRNVKDSDRQQPRQNQQQPPQERRPSPETWRKPREGPPKPVSPEGGGRFGKAASAFELAQAFSGSLSTSMTAQRPSGQKGPGGQPQVPFSRLTGPATRPQINGY